MAAIGHLVFCWNYSSFVVFHNHL